MQRLVRCLSGTINLGTRLDAKGSLDDVVAWIDAGLAGDLQSRRSVTSVVITVGGSATYASSKRQRTTALSSGEAENYSASQGEADLLHFAELMWFVGASLRPKLKTDSAA